jgi:sporulation protein YlmC with PRC-barrel domain
MMPFFALVAQAQTDSPADERTNAAPSQMARPKVFCKASELIKYDVENEQGEDLGDVKDLLIDPVDERIALVVISYGGVLGMGDKLYAAPWNAISFRPNEKKIFLKIDKERIKKAPVVNGDLWPESLDDRWASELTTFYAITPYWKDKAGDAKVSAPSKAEIMLRRASVILDAKVENDANENLGEVEDLAIASEEGRVLYAVLSFGGILGLGEKYFAIPTAAFDLKPTDLRKLVLHVDKEKLKKAPGFDKDAWPNMADDRWVTEVHTYYNQKPFWDRAKTRSQ